MSELNTSILGASNKSDTEWVSYSDDVVLGTATGLVKTTNEDRVGLVIQSGRTRGVISDGHWGSQAAQICAQTLLNVRLFPETVSKARALIERIAKSLDEQYGYDGMDEKTDFTPEASCIAFECVNSKFSVLGYGDCRLLVLRNGRVHYDAPCYNTWLGAFSVRGLRGRLPLGSATFYDTFDLCPGDIIVAYTDGVDECVYEKPTLSKEIIAATLCKQDISDGAKELFKQIFWHGAEDNASIVIYRYNAK